MKILTLLISLIISLAVNAKVIHLECNGEYREISGQKYKTEVIIDVSKKTFTLPMDILFNSFGQHNKDRYPPYGVPPANYKLSISDDNYMGFRIVPNKLSTIENQTFFVDRKDLTFSLYNKMKGKHRRNLVSGQCKIYTRKKNLI